MRTLRTATIIAAVGLLAFAAPSSGDQSDGAKTCEAVETLARTIMQKRQEEVPLSAVLEAARKPNSHAVVDELTQALILAAYDTPAFSASVNRARAADRFANEAHLICLKALKSRKGD